MKKIFAFFLASGIFLQGVFCQSLTMEKVCAELSKHEITKGIFVQTKTILKINRSLRSSGEFVFCKEGIVWKTQKPFPSTLALGDGTMIQISPDGKKTFTDTSGNETFKNISATLASIFSNDINLLKENFEISFAEKSGFGWEAELSPKDKTVSSAIEKIFIRGVCSDSACDMNSVLINEKSGDKILYEFSNLKYPEALSSDEKSIFEK